MLISKLLASQPWKYGVFYFTLIPIFSVFYFFIPGVGSSSTTLGIADSLYFSAVTITTLGYGDFHPVTPMAKFIASTESVLGIMTIGLFLNALAHRQSEKSNEEQEQKEKQRRLQETIEKLRNHHTLISIKIRAFEFRCIPITNRVIVKTTQGYAPRPTKINLNFKFNDMRDLYLNSGNNSDDMFKPAIEYYFEAEKELVSELTELVRNVNLHFWPILNLECENFIEKNNKFDFSSYIISQKNIDSGGTPAIISASKMIENYNEPIEFKNGCNSINPYIALYYGIKHNLGFIENYKKTVSEILESQSPL